MEYGLNYSIFQLARKAKEYLDILDKVNIGYFTSREFSYDIPYDRTEILKTIQVASNIASEEVAITAHPLIHKAFKEYDFFLNLPDNQHDDSFTFAYSIQIYSHISYLINGAISLTNKTYARFLEKKISDFGEEYLKAIKWLTKIRQSDEYKFTHPENFLEFYRHQINKRINDLKELLQLDNIDFGADLKEIIKSYKLGLDINIRGRNLLSPLLERRYDVFIKNLKSSLFIPSYFDVTKKERESYFHIYLLGVLEGRLNLYKLSSNKESGFGRYDICATPINKNNIALLVEVKSDPSVSDEDAIQQVLENEYLYELKTDGIQTVLILSINFCDKQIRTKYLEHEIK